MPSCNRSWTVSDALASVVEAGQINIYGDELESITQLATVEERLRELKQICRSYGPTLKEATHYQRIQAELQELNAGDNQSQLWSSTKRMS